MMADSLEREVLKLPPERRAHLVERILESLEGEAEIDGTWLCETRRRRRDREVAITRIQKEDPSDWGHAPSPLLSCYRSDQALSAFIAAWKAEREAHRSRVR